MKPFTVWLCLLWDIDRTLIKPLTVLLDIYFLRYSVTIASLLRVLVFKISPLLSFYGVPVKTTKETLSGKVLYNVTYCRLFTSIELHFIFYSFAFFLPQLFIALLWWNFNNNNNENLVGFTFLIIGVCYK
jgi:hypothetical protein